MHRDISLLPQTGSGTALLAAAVTAVIVGLAGALKAAFAFSGGAGGGALPTAYAPFDHAALKWSAVGFCGPVLALGLLDLTAGAAAQVARDRDSYAVLLVVRSGEDARCFCAISAGASAWAWLGPLRPDDPSTSEPEQPRAFLRRAFGASPRPSSSPPVIVTVNGTSSLSSPPPSPGPGGGKTARGGPAAPRDQSSRVTSRPLPSLIARDINDDARAIDRSIDDGGEAPAERTLFERAYRSRRVHRVARGHGRGDARTVGERVPRRVAARDRMHMAVTSLRG